MGKQTPELTLKKRIAAEGQNAANVYKTGKYKGSEEKLIDVIESAIDKLCKEFPDDYSQSVIRNTMAAVVLTNI